MKLYEINNEVHDLLTAAILYKEENGEYPEGAKEELKGLKLEFAAKLEAIWCEIKNTQAESDALAAEIKRLTAMKKTRDNTIDWLKNYAGEELNGSPFKHKLGGFGYRKSAAVEITDLEAVPMAYCSYEKKPDKRSIKEDLKAKAEIPGCKLVEKNSLVVK